MNSHERVRRVAIVGTGTIGASWATHYLARGFDVVATDPAPGAETALRDSVTKPGMEQPCSGSRTGLRRIVWSSPADMREAVGHADFVQENAPERPELKVKLFAEMDDAVPIDSILASSSSSITIREIQATCRHPERTVIGHPFNPPHLIPDTISSYASIGKRPIHLKKELPRHVANRVQAALYREVVYVIDQAAQPRS